METKFSTSNKIPFRDRFFGRIHIDATGCWIWTGCTIRKDGSGYGAIWRHGKHWACHRLMWHIVNGAIPDHLCVCHTCDNPRCVNPDHLFLGTITDNNRDAKQKGRTARGERMWKSKLTMNDILNIRARLDAGEVQRYIARDYNVHEVTISAIKHNRNWAWLS